MKDGNKYKYKRDRSKEKILATNSIDAYFDIDNIVHWIFSFILYYVGVFYVMLMRSRVDQGGSLFWDHDEDVS